MNLSETTVSLARRRNAIVEREGNEATEEKRKRMGGIEIK